ncbi:TetR/AcrR family transcriptional regulator [Pseudonocardia spinosispora]|uniref:TetR/AcrR family transcriptional regulator n=1 Tax=Pseudonocardia spinosispora TaxID=103441 RepID=UPI000426FC63|nr:TetR/AcrR family transcriptional regulator [Pseudonocardia spinosispora]
MPRPQTVIGEELLGRLAEVFRAAGFEGASLGALAEAAQLRRASLYHRFPDGKTQMALAVLEFVEALFVEALGPMRTEPDVAQGVAESAEKISELYGRGLLSCVMEALTLAGTPDAVRNRATQVAATWIGAMEEAAIRGGTPADEARRAAQDAFARVEGGLVYGRLFGDAGVFQRALAELPGLLVASTTREC